MNRVRKLLLSVLFLVLVVSSTASANAIIPVLQFFDPFLFIPSLVLLIVIILIEAIVLKRFLKSVKFHKHLFFSLLINITSSIVGSSLGLLGYFDFSIFLLDFIFVAFGLPFIFIITCLSEYPVIFFLYRKMISARQAIWLDVKINFISYIVFVVLMSPAFLFGIMKMSEHMDNKLIKEWSHKEILQQESGKLYTVKEIKHTNEYELSNFDFTEGKWKPIKQFATKSSIYPVHWDISKSFIAYSSDSNFITVLKKDDFSELYKITVECDRLKISKNEQQIAVLQYFGRVSVKKKSDGWEQTLGTRCKLKIYEFASGRQISEYDKFIMEDGLDWSPDSQKLLIVTLQDSDILTLENHDIKKDSDNDLYLKEFCPQRICLYDISTNSVSVLCEGTNPQWNKSGKEFIFTKGDKIFVCDVATIKVKPLCDNYGCDKFYWSSSGQNILGLIRTRNPMWTNKFFLVVINVQNPELKHVIDVGDNYLGLNWCPN